MQPAPPPTPFHLPSPDITPLSSISSSSPSSASLSLSSLSRQTTGLPGMI